MKTKYPLDWTTKDKYRFRVYGLSPEQYKGLNHGSCPICLRSFSDSVKPCVDHDHVAGVVRGIVCTYCNHRIIGRHRDPELLLRVANYLKGPFELRIPPKKKKRKKRKRK